MNRYRLDISSPQLARMFSADAGPDPWAGGEVIVGQFAPVITRSGKTARRVIRPMHWGYPPPGQPSDAPGLGPPRWVASVRNFDSPFWIGNLRHHELRCLVPVSTFWLSAGSGKRRQQLACSLAGEAAFALAGIWRDLTDMPVFALLATDPSSALLPVEGGKGPESMPVILKAEDHDRWLSADWKEAQALAKTSAAAALKVEALA
jgi:putative SOS response-associated peptidase YedK